MSTRLPYLGNVIPGRVVIRGPRTSGGSRCHIVKVCRGEGHRLAHSRYLLPGRANCFALQRDMQACSEDQINEGSSKTQRGDDLPTRIERDATQPEIQSKTKETQESRKAQLASASSNAGLNPRSVLDAIRKCIARLVAFRGPILYHERLQIRELTNTPQWYDNHDRGRLLVNLGYDIENPTDRSL